MPAPVALFLYNRPTHTERALMSLLACPEAARSPLYLFCDGPKSAEQVDAVQATRAVARRLAPPHAIFVERDENKGLAGSIIDGVTRLCAEHGRVIVLEDDLRVAPRTLSYLNAALDRYETTTQVMHISAYMYPVRAELPPSFFLREATCWGWATWKHAWDWFEPDPQVILKHVRENRLEHAFNRESSMYFLPMLESQALGRSDSWAIRWYGTLFMAGGLALHPARSFVSNEGFDGSGVHGGVTTEFAVELVDQEVPPFPDRIEECRAAFDAVVEYRRPIRGHVPQVDPSPKARLRRALASSPLLSRLARRVLRP